MNTFGGIPSTDISINELELSKIYQEQYNDIFPNIKNMNQNSFISILEKQVSLYIKIQKKNYSFSYSLIKKVQNTFTKIYLNDRATIQNSIKYLLKIKNDKLPFLEKTNYYIHCEGCNEALHKCGNSLIYYQNNIYCLSCEEVYKPYHLFLYCSEHNINYYSSIRDNSKIKKKILFDAEFTKNHCDKSNNILMKCPFCKSNLYIDISKGKKCYDNLICETCEKIYETSNLFFTCDICGKKYKSEAKIYINFDKKKIENLCIIHSIIKNELSSPSIILNKECKCDLGNNIQYKHFCGGILLEGNFINKRVIVCNKCYMIIDYDKFIWNCPFCNKKINTKIIRTCKSSYKKQNCLKNLNEISSYYYKNNNHNESENNNIKNSINNLSLRLSKRKSETNCDFLNNINYNKEINSNRILTDSKIDFKNHCTPSETKKMHNILFEFMNIKNGKNSFRSNHKPKTNIIICPPNVSSNEENNNNYNNNNSDNQKEKIKENKLNINKIININNFPDLTYRQLKQKFIGKNSKIIEVKSNNKIEDNNKKEIENSDNNISIKLNTNSNGKNSSSTNSESIEKNSFSKNLNNNFFEEEENNFDSENYEIIKLIGEGTFGKIYLVENPITLKRYAMKKISANSMKEINEKKKEYELLIKLNHENPNLNTVKIFSIQTKKLDKLTFVMYIFMELADYDWEREIKARARKKLYYSEKELINILKSLIETFSLLQTKGISHRDIKPQNILCFLNNNNNNNNIIYKIADFGEAKTKEKKILEEQKSIDENYNNDTNKQTVRGTELYMSPILFKAYRTYPYIGNVQYNAFKNDVFSLGLTFLFASTLTFQSLYEIREINEMDILRSIVEKYLNERYSKSFINIIVLMLQIKEKRRPDFVDLDSWIKNNYHH